MEGVLPMTTLILASGNRGKLKEFADLLQPLGLHLRAASDQGIDDFPPEDGDSYRANASIKAKHACARSGKPALADDSGIEVDALDGAPGIYSARFGNVSSDAERLVYLLEQIRDVPEAQRGARFVCAIALALPDGREKHFQASCPGTMLYEARGQGGFGYDPAFFSPELGKTFAEASRAEKHRVSHRGHALRALLAWAKSPEGQAWLA